MASTATDTLGWARTQLDVLTRGSEQATLDRWGRACDELATARLASPAELQGWLRQRPTRRADEVIRSLVRLAQRGDTVALLAVLVCLAPGIRALGRRTGVSADEAVSEVTLRVLEYPYARRRSVAGGILLDARNRITRARRRAPEPVEDVGAVADRAGPAGRAGPTDRADRAGPLGPAARRWGVPGSAPDGPPGDAAGRTTAERILELICEARRRDLLNQDDAQLIVDTRLSGQRLAPAAARLGISAQAAYQRRTRAERRISSLADDRLT